MRAIGAAVGLLWVGWGYGCEVWGAQTAQPPTSIECVADVYPPYTVESAGLVSGLGADLLVEAGRQVGLHITIRILPFARIENELKRGAASKVQCAYAFSRTAVREAYMLFGTVPQSVTRYVLYAKPGAVATEFPGWRALNGTRLGIRFAFRVPELLQQAADRGDLTLESVVDDELNFRKLALGRLDYVLTNQDVGDSMLRRLQRTDIRMLRPAVAEFPTFVVFSKAYAQAPVWRNAVDQGLRRIRTNGIEQSLRERYLR